MTDTSGPTLLQPQFDAPRPPRAASAVAAVPGVRSSAERAVSGLAGLAIDVLKGRLSSVDPMLPRRYLPYLLTISVTDPEVFQAVSLFSANANQGHDIVVDAPEGKEGLVAAAEASINAWAERVNVHGGGVEGLVNHMIQQVAVTGAISSEDVLLANRRGVARVVDVPAQDIEWRWGGDQRGWVPLQETGRGYLELDPRTYRYYAWRTAQNNPFAIPPFASAINSMLRQDDMDDQLDSVLEKQGWLGFLVIVVPPEDSDMESMEDPLNEHARRAKEEERLAQIGAKLTNTNYRKGIAVLQRGMEFQYQAAPGSAGANVEQFIRHVEERKFSGLGIGPQMFGRQWAQSETFIGTVKTLLQDYSENFQRLVAKRLEDSVRLQLLLEDLRVSASVAFKPIPRLSPLEQAQADSSHWSTILDKLAAGAINPDRGAAELGLDDWFDPTRIPKTPGSGFGERSAWSVIKEMVDWGVISPQKAADLLGVAETWFDPSKIGGSSQGLSFPFSRAYRFRYRALGNRYEFQRPRLPDVESKPAPQAKSYAGEVTAIVRPDRALRDLVRRFMARYAGRLAPVLDEMQVRILADLRADLVAANPSQWRDEDEFGRWALDRLNRSFRTHYREYGNDALIDRVAEAHGEIYEGWRTEDRTIWAQRDVPESALKLVPEDERAISSLTQSDAFHMSVYLDDMSGDERKHLERLVAQEFAEGGRDVTDPDVADDLVNRMARSGGMLIRRRDHGREGGAESETDEQAFARMGYRVRRIVNTSVMRSRNTTAILGMNEAGITHMKFVATKDGRTSDLCRAMDGQLIPVELAASYLHRFHAMSAEQQERELKVLKASDVVPQLEAGNMRGTLPPLHPNCRSRIEAEG